MKRGEIWFVDVGRGGDRPVPVLTRDPVAETTEPICTDWRSEPLALIVPIRKSASRTFGHDSGLFTVPEDFDAPLPDDIIADFEG